LKTSEDFLAEVHIKLFKRKAKDIIGKITNLFCIAITLFLFFSTVTDFFALDHTRGLPAFEFVKMIPDQLAVFSTF
jgi:hypothetical protein